tara:strand:+ start:3240 stop:3887 length:648 start_codon:yes stop_codon:yes gene_type:complete
LKGRSSEDIMLERAVSQLDLSKPQGLIMQDILYNQIDSGPYESKLFPPPKEEGDLSLFDFVEGTNTKADITTTDNQAINNSNNVTPGFDYNDYNNPDYLSNVAGRTITMPDGEVRSYSKSGESYNIPAESWMGVADSHYEVTTHNKISGAAQPISKQYVGVNASVGIPLAIGVATAPASIPVALGAQIGYQALTDPKGLVALPGQVWNFAKGIFE